MLNLVVRRETARLLKFKDCLFTFFDMQPNEDYRAGAATYSSLLTSDSKTIECADGPFVGFVVKLSYLM
jgi:hypothetical protein